MKNYYKGLILIFISLILFYIVLSPFLADHYYLKALISRDKKEYNKSVMYLKKAKSFNPYELFYSRSLAELYIVLTLNSNYETKWINACILEYQNLIRKQPFNSEIHYNFGRFLHMISRVNPSILKDAIIYYENAVQLYPKYPMYKLMLADTYLDYYKISKSAIYLEKSYKIYKRTHSMLKNKYRVYYGLGRYYYYKDNKDRAVIYFEKAKEQRKEEPDVHIWLGNIYFEKKEIEKSIKHLKKALELNPEFPAGIHNQLGNVYRYIGDIKLAEREYKKALSLSPNYTGAKKNLQSLK